MPIQKTRRKREPLWRDWDQLAQKGGLRAPVTSVNGDIYTGEWRDNKKHGESQLHGSPASPARHTVRSSLPPIT